jgi:hypothetical protein
LRCAVVELRGPAVDGHSSDVESPAELAELRALANFVADSSSAGPDDGEHLRLRQQCGTTVSSVLAAADSALYKAKRAGRNAVEVADG